MGSVKLETRNEGRGQREWDYLPLSEERVVSNLIKNRSRLDAAYYPSLVSNGVESTSGAFLFSEPIICTYIDIERLIEQSSLSKMENYVVKYLMRGYTLADIASRCGRTRQSFEVAFRRAVKKICRQNNKNWEEVYSKR